MGGETMLHDHRLEGTPQWCVDLQSDPEACQVEIDQLMPRRVGLGRLGRWLDTAIHPLWVIPAHSRLPKIAAKGSAQRCDGVT